MPCDSLILYCSAHAALMLLTDIRSRPTCNYVSFEPQGSHRFWKFWESFGISKTLFQALEKYGIWSLGLEKF